MAQTTKRQRILVGSTAGRGPCDSCGVIAELHEVLEDGPAANQRSLSVCLPCAFDAEPAPSRKAA
jgi:hypothetical protein